MRFFVLVLRGVFRAGNDFVVMKMALANPSFRGVVPFIVWHGPRRGEEGFPFQPLMSGCVVRFFGHGQAPVIGIAKHGNHQGIAVVLFSIVVLEPMLVPRYSLFYADGMVETIH